MPFHNVTTKSSYGILVCFETATLSVLTATRHRADFVYMAPPFIAYYGGLHNNDEGLSLLREAYDQCRLYRQYLSDDNGLWQHIVLGDGAGPDYNHWGTGEILQSSNLCVVGLC